MLAVIATSIKHASTCLRCQVVWLACDFSSEGGEDVNAFACIACQSFDSSSSHRLGLLVKAIFLMGKIGGGSVKTYHVRSIDFIIAPSQQVV